METISQSQPPPSPGALSPIIQTTPISNFPVVNQQYKAVFSKILEQIFKTNENSKGLQPPKPETESKASESTIIRLKKPKIDRQIDFSSLIILPKKKKSQPSSPKIQSPITTMNLRRSSSSIFEPVKNISTPNWSSSKPNRKANKENEINMDTYDIAATHSRIEIYEYRIQMGEDENHLHPALARIAAYESVNDEFSKSEVEKTERYRVIEFNEKTPLFWPERVYDSEESKMTTEQSEKLMRIIQQEINSVGETKAEKARKTIMRSHSTGIPSPKKSHSHDKQRKIGRPPKINSIAQICFDNFLTEDEDLTDFDF